MYCKYCGKEIRDDSTFCDGCGKQLEVKRKKNKGPAIIFSAVAISILVAISPIVVVLLINIQSDITASGSNASAVSNKITSTASTDMAVEAKYDKEFQNLKDVLNGEEIKRSPDKYDGKEMEFAGSVIYLETKNIVITISSIAKLKARLDEISPALIDKYINAKEAIRIPYVNNRSPRLLVCDDISFKGIIHAKLVGTEVQVSIDTITDMKIISE